MTVIVAENTPDKVRGLLKRWFIEPKPNVFAGSVNSRIRGKVLQYLLKYSPDDLSLLVICDDTNSQGFKICHYHDPHCKECCITGHYLLANVEDTSLLFGEDDDACDSARVAATQEAMKKSLISYAVHF